MFHKRGGTTTYISKLKGGVQYLDSLDGEKTEQSAEDSYKKKLFYFRQKAIEAAF